MTPGSSSSLVKTISAWNSRFEKKNAPNFSNKQSGTLTFAGSTDGIVSGADGSENRGGKIIVNGATKYYYFWNDGATVEVNADVTMVYQMKNYNDEHKSEAKIIVASNGTLKANNHSVLAPETATYVGNGTIYGANATFKWQQGSTWTGNRY